MSWIDDLPAELADTISEEYKTNPSLTKYENFDGFLKGHINAASLVGNSIRVPGEDAGETDKQEFYQKLMNHAPDLMLKPDFSEPEQNDEFWKTLGKPDEIDKYEMPEGNALPEEVTAEMRQIAFEADMTKAQFKKWADGMSTRHTEATGKATEAMEAQMAELKTEWGMTTDERLNAAKAVNEQFYPGRDFEALTPAEKKGLYDIHVSMTGKGPQGPAQPNPQAGMTPQEARDQADEIMRRLHDPKTELSHSEKMALIDKRIKILQKFVPEFAED